MGERVTFSGQHLNLANIAAHYTDVEAALRHYFADPLAQGNRFAGYTPDKVYEELEQRLEEEDRGSVLSILATLEAAFRISRKSFCAQKLLREIDYLQRVYKRKKDVLSKEFRALYKTKGTRISLDDIFSAWTKHSNAPKRLISDLRGAFNYRHWLAHGRYWNPKLGQRYDYDSIYRLADNIFNSFPFIEN